MGVLSSAIFAGVHNFVDNGKGGVKFDRTTFPVMQLLSGFYLWNIYSHYGLGMAIFAHFVNNATALALSAGQDRFFPNLTIKDMTKRSPALRDTISEKSWSNREKLEFLYSLRIATIDNLPKVDVSATQAMTRLDKLISSDEQYKFWMKTFEISPTKLGFASYEEFLQKIGESQNEDIVTLVQKYSLLNPKQR